MLCCNRLSLKFSFLASVPHIPPDSLTIYRHAFPADLLVGEGGDLAGVAAAQVERGPPQEERAMPLEAVPRVGDRVVQVQVARKQLSDHLVEELELNHIYFSA